MSEAVKKSKQKKKLKIKSAQSDPILFNVVLILLCFGLVMCFSASAPSAKVMQGDSYYYLKKQLIWAVIGLFAMMFMANFPYKSLRKYSNILYIVTCIMLAVTLAFPAINGARRWIGIGGFSFQPSEVAKISLIVLLADRLSKVSWDKKAYPKSGMMYIEFIKQFIPFGIFALLLMLEPHFSCTLLLGAVTCVMIFISGGKIMHFVGTISAAIPALIVVVMNSGYRLQRITSFLDPFADPQGDGYQAVQSLYAIGSGGLFGMGLGQSRQKYLYIPEPQNDFIFSILCEELGFIGAITVIALFVILIWRGLYIAINSKDKFASLLAVGITALIAIQVVVNIAVVTASMPVTGMPLPFFSAGGSSLVFIMASMGILLNISKSIDEE